jgi:lysozyme family protein
MNLPLSEGDNNKDVKTLQKSLLALGEGYAVPTSGVFGASTAAAVRQFQQSRDLRVTGFVDQQTWDALQKASAGSKFMSSAMNVFSFVQPFAQNALQGPPPYTPTDMSLPPEEAGPDWLLISGVALGGLVLLGGFVYVLRK